MSKKNSPIQFENWELDKSSVISKMETTANDGKNFLSSFYNLILFNPIV